MHSAPLPFSDRWQRKASSWMHSGLSFRSDCWQTQASSRKCWSPCWMRHPDRQCWVRQPPQTVANPRADVTAQNSLAAQLSHQILCHPSLHGVAATDRCPSGQHRRSVQADGWFHRGKLTPPQFIRAGVFMCRHIHRGGNGGPFLFPCTAGSTVATCVHRIGHMAYSTQLTIPAMHAHIKATESIILILSPSTGSRTLLPRTRWLRLPSLGAHDTSTGTTTASPSPDNSPGLPAAVTHTEKDNSRHTQLPACTTKGAFKTTAMCILCVPVCVCLQKHKGKKQKKGSRVCGETHNKNVQRRCVAEATRRRPPKLTTALQSKQRQSTQDLLKTKKLSPSTNTNPITQNNYK
ncbi:hypothetical protein TCDM_10930 [Trypanosoma cruzi Dm28c]|uniref:Uncharacterized protein n=1 Tax=Trypanosoma cruzi Dm28c TaxID=1416333 RepID=V5D1Y2_TRYCR|nr:hypothetical protein TCDM_10930 [Trypanosoma cruzi Dm28c]